MTNHYLTDDGARTKWDEAFQRLLAAERAMEEYIDATDPLYALESRFRARHGVDGTSNQPGYLDRIKALREANPAYFVPEFINSHRDSLVDNVVTIEGELMAMPAPDHAALRWKLDKTGGTAWVPDYLSQMYRDMDRLLGQVPYASVRSRAAA